MLDRESSFSNPEIVALLKNQFVPVAIDQAYQRRQKDAEGRFYQKIANGGPRKVGDGGPTTQGHYTADAEGNFLGYNNNRDPRNLRVMLNNALKKFEPKQVASIETGKSDSRFVYGPPEGGLAVRVYSRILGGYKETTNPWKKIFQQGTGRDNFWIRKDEHEALVGGELPSSLVTRMLRFHFVDNTRGEPPMWKEEEIRDTDLVIQDGKLKGTVLLRTETGDRAFEANVLGFVESDGKRVTRFDLVVRGGFQGEGRYTKGAPEGVFPLAIVFTLADGSDIADAIPPQGSRGWLDGYIR